METYDIWRRPHYQAEWSRTSHSVKARTDKEAQARVRQKFAGAGFSSMALVAIPQGKTPNAKVTGATLAEDSRS